MYTYIQRKRHPDQAKQRAIGRVPQKETPQSPEDVVRFRAVDSVGFKALMHTSIFMGLSILSIIYLFTLSIDCWLQREIKNWETVWMFIVLRMFKSVKCHNLYSLHFTKCFDCVCWPSSASGCITDACSFTLCQSHSALLVTWMPHHHWSAVR